MSTRKVDDLVKSLGFDTGISKAEVSRIRGLDDGREAFRTRPLGHVEIAYLFLDDTLVQDASRAG